MPICVYNGMQALNNVHFSFSVLDVMAHLVYQYGKWHNNSTTSVGHWNLQTDLGHSLNNLLIYDLSWNRRCGPCKLMAPKFQDLSEKNHDIVFLKLDCNQENKVFVCSASFSHWSLKSLGFLLVQVAADNFIVFPLWVRRFLAGSSEGARNQGGSYFQDSQGQQDCQGGHRCQVRRSSPSNRDSPVQLNLPASFFSFLILFPL